MNTEPMVYRVSEAAELLRTSRAQAYVLVANGTLPSIRIGNMIRIPADALRELIEQAKKRGADAQSEREDGDNANA